MKFLFDLFPIILFFAAFKAFDIYIATGVVIAATAAQIGWVWHRHGKVDTMLWISLALVVVFGGATLLLHDETFIKWKPTVLYWLFATTLFGSAQFFGKNLIRAMLEKEVQLPDSLWSRLNLAWVGFFAVMGVANLWVAFNFSTDTWVSFKLFGGMGLMIAFIILQGIVLAKYIPEEKDASPQANAPAEKP
ncbi:MAG: intracellular septation protein [Rhodocyclaceae bacterium]|nr:MAG: intracellular septation protein [Rhodocyclaceae bacterium]TND00285.1 MAG: intracellular septation protein [Rhodocyclaceae bacterium]